MAVIESTQIVVAERLNDGLVIQFGNGKCAFYSTSLLLAMLPQAQELDETRTDW